MQSQPITEDVCPQCGTRLEGGFSRGLGRCMICLLRIGFDEAEGPDDALFTGGADRLGIYRIERQADGTLWELGRGAMGVTYRAVDTSLQRPVALKLIGSEWAKRGAEARERFMREARAAATLRHPNVATVYHFGIREENGQCFCAMELVEGETLEARVRRTGPLEALTTIEIALQVSSALAAAEKQGLVHRDLKPANLMLVTAAPDANDPNSGKTEEPDTVVKVIDFGVAKALAEKPHAMPLTHGFVGTPAFASPEQFAEAPVDVRSDIYSLGATLWYLLTAHMPFSDASVGQIRASQLARVLPVEQLKAARVPARLISLIVSMLASEPAARPGVRTLTAKLQECRAQILDRWKTVRRLALATALIGIAVALLFRPFGSRISQSTGSVPDKSIAVLPFENRSEEKEDAFFADGMQDDLLTSLVKIKELKVVGRTSVMSYRDGAKRNLRQIGLQLGVAHVLEGSVRRFADRVLIHVNLTDTRNGRAVWAERYDRTLANSITLQGELASEIARALRATLSRAEKARVETKATDNPEAYVSYLRGREAQLRPEVSREMYLNAESFYKQALALDPRFVLARARLSFMQARLYQYFEPTNAARIAEARANAEEALRLDPNSAEAHLSLAKCASLVQDETTTRRELTDAVQLLPNDASIAMEAATIQTNWGWDEEAAANYQRATELGPREPKIFYAYGLLLSSTGHEAEARAALDRALVLAPESVLFRLIRARTEISWSGDIGRAKAILAGLPAGQDPDGRVTSAYCDLALLERNFSEALRLLQAYRLETLPLAGSGGTGGQEPKATSEGTIHLYAGDRARAYECFDSARWRYEADVRDNPGSAGCHSTLALVYAWMGWKEPAMAEAARVIELETSAAVPPKRRKNLFLAEVYAWAAEPDLALRQIEQFLASGAKYYTIHNFRLDPRWDPLRKDPRFQKLLETKKL